MNLLDEHYSPGDHVLVDGLFDELILLAYPLFRGVIERETETKGTYYVRRLEDGVLFIIQKSEMCKATT